MSRYLPDFAGILCLAVFLITLTAISDDMFRDGDSFWHIKVGTVMLERQSLINSDIFSHTAFGKAWTAHEWLSEIIMASIYSIAGLEGILCFFLFIVSITFWLLYKITEKHASQLVTLACVSLALAFSPMHLAARPHLFTWLFMVLTLAILIYGGKRLLWLPVITVIWANLHGGFILGLVLQGLFILGAGLERLLTAKVHYREALRGQQTPALILLLSICAVGLNPFGYELLAFPFEVSKGVFSEMINEWKAPDLQVMWYFRYYLVALVLLLSSTISAVTWTERFLIVFFLNAALTHIRHIGLMLIALTPFIARMIDNHFERWHIPVAEQSTSKQLRFSPISGPLLTAVIAAGLILSGSIDHRVLKFLSPEKMFGVEREHLNQLTGFLDENLPEGKMFNEYSLGGYLLYALTPPPKVFIDSRADMYGEQILSDYDKILSSNSDREKLLEQYQVDWVVYEQDSDLVTALEKSGSWQRTYANAHYAVLTRVENFKPPQGSPN